VGAGEVTALGLRQSPWSVRRSWVKSHLSNFYPFPLKACPPVVWRVEDPPLLWRAVLGKNIALLFGDFTQQIEHCKVGQVFILESADENRQEAGTESVLW